MLRKSVAILAVFLSFIATEAVALGLGRVSVESSLNQPLRVRIEILQLGDTRLEDVTIQVASPEDFQRFNIERATFLNNIRFDTDVSPQGNFVILTTNQIVREPYLSFILETRWTNGRLLSEHTILLDLPVYEDAAVPEVAVRQPISTVLTTRSAPRVAEPTAVAPTSSAPSVQPIIQPEVIAPSTPDTASEETVAVEDVAPEESPAADSLSQIDSTENDEPTALTQNAADESSAQEELIEEVVVAEEPADESSDDSAPATDLEEVPSDTIDNNSEELAAEPEVIDEPATDNSVTEELAETEPETIVTGSTDTLSGIALRIRPDDSVSIQQTMLAIQELNPDAFTGGNINRLRSGEVLRVPSITDIQAIGQREAVAEVSRQNQQAITDVQPLAAPSNAVPAQDEEASGQLSVITSDPDADSTAGAGVMEDADDSVLNDRIAELENQLALREEEADRARIEKEELESRLAELDEQIAAAQEIIRLRDLQLAQLQQSLADAAAEAALQAEAVQVEAAQVAEPIPTEVTTTQPQATGLVDSLLRMLMSNSLVLIAAVVAVILLLAGFLVMRNKAKPPEEDLDRINEDEFKGVTDAKDVIADDDDDSMGSEFHDYEEAELDSELDEIISLGGQTQSDSSGFSADPVLDADQDIAAEADLLIQNGQLDQADLLLAQALSENPDDSQLLLKQLEVTAAGGDLSAFEMRAEILQNKNDPAFDAKIDSLRKELTTSTIAESPLDDSAISEAETQRQKAETASFLDDLGIDLDSFEDDSFHLADDPIEKTPTSKPIEVSLDDMPPEAEPESIDLMFDLGAESDPVVSEPTLEVSVEDEKAIEENGIEFDDNEVDEGAQVELTAEAVDKAGDFETLDFDQNAESEPAEGDSKDPEDLEIDTLEFDVAEPAEKASSPAETEEELDLETFSFDPPPAVSAPVEEPASDTENNEDDDNVLDFDFDKADIKAEPEVEAVIDSETFDFDLDDDSTATVVEKSGESEPEGSEDEISLDFGDLEEADNAAPVNDESVAAIEDDFDFDLNELEIDADDIDVSDVEIGLTDDDFLDLDSEAATEEINQTSSDKPSADLNSAVDDGVFGFDDEFEVPPTKADTVVESAAGTSDDLGFLSEDDAVFEATDFEGDPESLSDEDETATKLELAYAYQKMGDAEGAQEILREVISEGTEAQVKEAKGLIETLSSSSD